MATSVYSFRTWVFLAFLMIFMGCSGPRDGGGIIPRRVEPLVGWSITLTKVLVVEAEERRSFLGIPVDDGDEPYFVMVGVKATLGTSGNTVVRANDYRDKGWAGHLRDGQQKTIPSTMGGIRFDGVSRKDVIGIVVIAVEADMTPWTMIDERVAALSQNLESIFLNTVESRAAINVSTSAFVNELHTSMQAAARVVTDPANASESFERRVYSLNDIDDVVGINTMVLMMEPPSDRLIYPSYRNGLLTDVLSVPGTDYRFYEKRISVRYQ